MINSVKDVQMMPSDSSSSSPVKSPTVSDSAFIGGRMGGGGTEDGGAQLEGLGGTEDDWEWAEDEKGNVIPWEDLISDGKKKNNGICGGGEYMVEEVETTFSVPEDRGKKGGAGSDDVDGGNGGGRIRSCRLTADMLASVKDLSKTLKMATSIKLRKKEKKATGNGRTDVTTKTSTITLHRKPSYNPRVIPAVLYDTTVTPLSTSPVHPSQHQPPVMPARSVPFLSFPFSTTITPTITRFVSDVVETKDSPFHNAISSAVFVKLPSEKDNKKHSLNKESKIAQPAEKVSSGLTPIRYGMLLLLLLDVMRVCFFFQV
jgi:hypothetical protein